MKSFFNNIGESSFFAVGSFGPGVSAGSQHSCLFGNITNMLTFSVQSKTPCRTQYTSADQSIQPGLSSSKG